VPEREEREMDVAATETVQVQLGERSYPIVVGNGVIQQLGTELAVAFTARRVCVVTNPTIRALYGARVVGLLEASGFTVDVVEIPDGEAYKHIGTLSAIYDRILALKPERSWPIVALGGGVVGDVAGFAAATLLRGMPFVQVPTTLLAQVDSSVGGKTGINHDQGKNLIGAFYQPSSVWIDLDTLASLPRREFLAGLAEVIKYGVILDADLFALLEDETDAIVRMESDILRHVVARCCRLKADVVGADERESGMRAVLNFGHTLGHAVENLMGYGELLHGEAVAIGMVFAARLSAHLGACDAAAAQRVVDLLVRVGLPVEIPRQLADADLGAAVAGDKKMSGGQVKFVLMTGIGATRFERLGMEPIVRHVASVRAAGA